MLVVNALRVHSQWLDPIATLCMSICSDYRLPPGLLVSMSSDSGCQPNLLYAQSVDLAFKLTALNKDTMRIITKDALMGTSEEIEAFVEYH